MKKKSPNDLLDESIQLMEIKRDMELVQLKLELNGVLDSLKPINIIKNTLKKATTSTDLKEGIGKTALGVASSLLVKNVLFRKTHNPLKLFARGMLQTVAIGFAANSSDKLKLTGQKFLHSLLSKIVRK